MKKYLVDTNVILNSYEMLSDDKYIVSSHALREIEKHEHSKDAALSYKARQVKRFLNENSNISYDLKDYTFNLNEIFDTYYEDNRMLQACVQSGYGLVTNDILLKLKAEGFDVEVIVPSEENVDDDYCGYKEVCLTEDALAYLYENSKENTYGLLVNEYLIVKNENGNPIDCLKWNGSNYIECQEKNLNTVQLGKFKALDLYQKAAVDSLMTNDITLLRGKAGSGKSIVALTYLLYQLEKGKIARIVILVNPTPVFGAQELGFYKGSLSEKLMQSGIGNILTSKIGDKNMVEAMIATGKLVLIPFVDIRGYDTGDDSGVWITEAQNLSVELMRLGLQRIGRKSTIIIDGDDKTQIDKSVFAGANNGIKRMSKVFRGERLYGEVTFNKIYRSEIALIADRM